MIWPAGRVLGVLLGLGVVTMIKSGFGASYFRLSELLSLVTTINS